MRDEDKTKSQLVGALVELRRRIAEREALESELKQSEERYKELADSLPQPVFETDERGNLTFTSIESINPAIPQSTAPEGNSLGLLVVSGSSATIAL